MLTTSVNPRTMTERRGRKARNECVKVGMKRIDWSRMILIIEISGGVRQLETV